MTFPFRKAAELVSPLDDMSAPPGDRGGVEREVRKVEVHEPGDHDGAAIEEGGDGIEAAARQRVTGLEPVSIAGSPSLALGASVAFDCKLWSTDVRERLPEGDPLREGFKGSPRDGSRESVKRLEQLHNVALRVTEIRR